jgi:cysteine protease ATG4
VTLRLGLDHIPDKYFPIIKKYMKFPQFIGLIGGKPNLAFYFVGI